MELNTRIKALLAIISQCSVKDATLAVIKFQSLYLMIKDKKLSISDILAKCPLAKCLDTDLGYQYNHILKLRHITWFSSPNDSASVFHGHDRHSQYSSSARSMYVRVLSINHTLVRRCHQSLPNGGKMCFELFA